MIFISFSHTSYFMRQVVFEKTVMLDAILTGSTVTLTDIGKI